MCRRSGYLSGWDGVVGQVSDEAAAAGASSQAVDGMTQALASVQQQIQGVAGTSLGEGFQLVYLVAAIAAALSAVLTLFISARSAAPVRRLRPLPSRLPLPPLPLPPLSRPHKPLLQKRAHHEHTHRIRHRYLGR
jgi:hypothetical protein